MKTMQIEKEFIFETSVRAVRTIDVKSALTYQNEKEGIRCTGLLTLVGSYIATTGQCYDFEESIEMNILAPKHKLGNETFRLELGKTTTTVSDGTLLVGIELQIYGVEEKEVREEIEEENQEIISKEEFEDLFEDDESTYTSYRLVVARANDTYTAIANRYQVDEQELRNCNQNKELEPKTLIILPS